MKPHPRIRKTIKWGGLVMTTLFGGVWIASLVVRPIAWETRHGLSFSLGGGCEIVQYWPGSSRKPGLFFPRPFGPTFWFETNEVLGQITWFVPGWFPFTACLVATVVARKLDAVARRSRLNLCPKCNYDRTGLAAGAVCPECGAAPASSSTT